MDKFGWLPDGENTERYEYANIWVRETTTGPDRLVIAPRAYHTTLLQKLAGYIQEPFLLLYVLVVPRGGSEAGRYQSKYSFTLAQLQEFLGSYSDFLEKDGRHNLWIRSELSEATFVYDRHNVINAYGPLDQLIPALTANGLMEAQEVRFPCPHSHHYHVEFDADEKRILHDEEWIISPLRAGDENPV